MTTIIDMLAGVGLVAVNYLVFKALERIVNGR